MMFGLLALAAAQTTTPCTATLCDAEVLRPVFRRMAEARPGRDPVRIVQIGDSHTAGDQITGAWRTALQTRYGSGGRGMLAPGRPYQGSLTRGVTVAQSPGWSVRGTFGASYSAASTVPIGLTSYTATATTPGAWMTLSADTPVQAFDHLTLCGLAAPGGGSVQMTLGATSVTWSLDALVDRPACHTISVATPTTNAEVKVLQGPVTLTSWTTERGGNGGVTLSNLGVVGAQLVHFERTDTRVLAAELAVARPDLIVVAFGTNEAFKPNFSAADYDASVRRGIERLQRLAPGVPILMIGAPDAATNQPALQRGADGTLSTCPGQAGWAPPAALRQVQAIQRRAAHALGVAYWDWGQRMGGPCTAHLWAGEGRMRGDHVHFTRPGADVIAGLLQQDIDAALGADTAAASFAPAPLRP